MDAEAMRGSLRPPRGAVNRPWTIGFWGGRSAPPLSGRLRPGATGPRLHAPRPACSSSGSVKRLGLPIRRAMQILFAFCAIAWLAGCDGGLDHDIVGTWSIASPGGPLMAGTMEFRGDGRCEAIEVYQGAGTKRTTGSWEVSGLNELLVRSRTDNRPEREVTVKLRFIDTNRMAVQWGQVTVVYDRRL